MLTSLSFLDVGQNWPPKSEAERLQLYEDNKNLFEGKHELVYKDWMRILREDQQASLYMVFNWPKRLSTLWADLLWGEAPSITAGEVDTPEQLNCQRLVHDNNLQSVGFETTIDKSRFGHGIYKTRFDGRGIIEAQPPSCWFPVCNPVNVKDITAHVLAWSWEDERVNVFGQVEKTKYLQCEIHTKGQIENRRYLIDGSVITKRLAWEGPNEIIKTGVDDFLVVVDNNILTSDRVMGLDDYSDIDSILQEMEVRLSQIARILDKHCDPNMYGPESALTYDPDTHQYGFKAGGKYFPIEGGDQAPGYMVWEGQLEAAFKELEVLQEQLYKLTETSPACFGELKAGLAESGSALKRLMMATLAKVNRMRVGADNAVKKVLQITAALEVAQGMKGALKLEDISIDWQDGLPADEKEEHAIENEDFMAGTISLETILKKRGLTGDALTAELEAIRSQEKAIEPPKIELEG